MGSRLVNHQQVMSSIVAKLTWTWVSMKSKNCCAQFRAGFHRPLCELRNFPWTVSINGCLRRGRLFEWGSFSLHSIKKYVDDGVAYLMQGSIGIFPSAPYAAQSLCHRWPPIDLPRLWTILPQSKIEERWFRIKLSNECWLVVHFVVKALACWASLSTQASTS